MYDLVLQLGVFISLGGIIYLISRSLPRISEAEMEPQKPFPLKKILAKLPLEKFDTALVETSEKFLRRFRVVVLKMDNWLNKKIAQMKGPGSQARLDDAARQSTSETRGTILKISDEDKAD